MGYANTVQRYGKKQFELDAPNSGASGLIIPDVPLEEFDDFFLPFTDKLDKILLTTPTSSPERIKNLDNKSTGFLYSVSVSGTTGMRESFDNSVLENLKVTYDIVSNNKMLIGFGISGKENIEQIHEFADGFIVGSSVINSLMNKGIDDATNLVKELKSAC